MIDTDATENFISSRLVTRLECAVKKKDKLYQLFAINDSSLSSANSRDVIKETESLSVAIHRHHEKLIFDIVKMINYDVVLETS